MSRYRLVGVIAISLLFAGVWSSAAAAQRTVNDETRATGEEEAAELARLAVRIEALKREAAAGRPVGAELERLLRRAQELAASLDRIHGSRAESVPRPAGPDPQELRERADALRDRADRAAAGLAAIDRRLAEVRRQAELERHLDALSDPGDLFVESAPVRAWASSSAARKPAGGTGGSPNGSADGSQDGATSTPTPTSTPTATSTPTTTTTTTAPAPRSTLSSPAQAMAPTLDGAGALEPGPDDSPAVLRRKRAALSRELEALRTQARSLDAQAAAMDAER